MVTKSGSSAPRRIKRLSYLSFAEHFSIPPSVFKKKLKIQMIINFDGQISDCRKSAPGLLITSSLEQYLPYLKIYRYIKASTKIGKLEEIRNLKKKEIFKETN